MAESSATNAQPARKQTAGESVKETIESILIAFVLAFVFRAFVVEAFVIPTGSMATTLLGAHMRFTCPDCGHKFTANFSSGENIDSSSGPNTVLSVHCQNCGLQIPRAMATDQPVHYGDRILVLKYLYLLQQPQRWDVVVFRNPVYDRKLNADYSQNYIKRLIGRPGEQIMLLDGNVYVAPADDQRPVKERAWQIARKPRVVQDALWRLVYDNDFLPQRPKWVQPWQEQGQGWTAGRSRIFTFDNKAGEGSLAFNPDALSGSPQTAWYPLTDWLSYDETGQHQPPGTDNFRTDAYSATSGTVPKWNVSDVKVAFFYERKSGDGPLRVALTKLGRTFTAEIGPAQARLLDGDKELARCEVPQTAAPLRVEFSNVDYQVTLRLDGAIALQTTSEQYSPNVPELVGIYESVWQAYRDDAQRHGLPTEADWSAKFPRPAISIAAARQSSNISHVSLWRDVYYTPADMNRRELTRGTPTSPVVLHRKGELGAGSDDEYFVCGDNSILSYDARLWGEAGSELNLVAEENLRIPGGRVPGRFMIGKALFVYWPAGFRPINDNLPGIVPNFGDMRFIH